MGLLVGEREPELRQSRLKQRPHHVHVRRIPEEQAEIIGVADEFRLTTKPQFDLSLEPKVYDVVEVDVCQLTVKRSRLAAFPSPLPATCPPRRYLLSATPESARVLAYRQFEAPGNA